MIIFGEENSGLEDNAPFLAELSEEEDNRLRIKIALSVLGESGEIASDDEFIGNEKIAKLISGSTPIYPDYDSIYEIIFDNYIMYQVRNESYAAWDNYEIRKGKHFVIFERSILLDYLSVFTDCQILSDGSYYPDLWTHYGICCQNHIIDIAAVKAPEIRRILTVES